MKFFVAKGETDSIEVFSVALKALRGIPGRHKIYLIGEKTYDWPIFKEKGVEGLVDIPNMVVKDLIDRPE